jgi:hypothetical protein
MMDGSFMVVWMEMEANPGKPFQALWADVRKTARAGMQGPCQKALRAQRFPRSLMKSGRGGRRATPIQYDDEGKSSQREQIDALNMAK